VSLGFLIINTPLFIDWIMAAKLNVTTVITVTLQSFWSPCSSREYENKNRIPVPLRRKLAGSKNVRPRPSGWGQRRGCFSNGK